MFSVPLNVSRVTTIHSPVAEVFATLADFKTWPTWSPWLCQQPDCPVTISGGPGEVGHQQSWDSARIGTGSIVLTNLLPEKRISYDLTFLKPWKSTSQAHFDLVPSGDATRVTWTMQGSLPFFLFFMKKQMASYVGLDFDRGLGMLKELLEKGEVPTRCKVYGEVGRPGFYYVGLEQTVKVAEVSKMEADFRSLGDSLSKGSLPQPHFMFCFYKVFDLLKDQCTYIAALGYLDDPSDKVTEQGLVTGHIPDHEALRVDHIGPYRFLGNGWSTIVSLQRELKKKPRKNISMYEIYANVPGQVDEKKLKTEIYMPIF